MDLLASAFDPLADEARSARRPDNLRRLDDFDKSGAWR
jgi:hypothetical protein